MFFWMNTKKYVTLRAIFNTDDSLIIKRMKKLLLILAVVLVSGLANAADTLTVRINGMRCEECATR